MFPRVCMCVKDSSSKNLQFSGGCGSWNENDENDDDDDDERIQFLFPKFEVNLVDSFETLLRSNDDHQMRKAL